MNELINYIIVNYMKYSYLVSLINIFKKKARLLQKKMTALLTRPSILEIL